MAFKSLIGGIRWKLHFIDYDLQCKRIYTFSNYLSNRMMNKGNAKTSYFHKIEENVIQVTIFLQHGSCEKQQVPVIRALKAPVHSLLEKINIKLEKVYRKLIKPNYKTTSIYPEVGALLLCNGEPVDANEMCSIIFDLDGELKLRLFGDYYVCLVNEPWITLVKISENPVSNTYIYPYELKTLFTEKCDIRWFKSLQNCPQDEQKWVQVGNNYHYVIQEDDMNHYLKLECIPINKNLIGPPYEIVTKNKVQLSQCSYYYSNTHELTKEEVEKDMFRLVSYNVLADYYVNTKEAKKIFFYCPSFAIHKDQRFSAIIKEITGYKPDIICLQEVDTEVFKLLLSPLFMEQDFYGYMCPKFKSAEGTACFYKKKKFTVLCYESYNYGDEIKQNPYLKNILLYVQDKDEVFEKITSLKHCLQLIALQSEIKRNEILIVGNVHLYSNPTAVLIRTLQVAASFGLLKSMLEELKPLLSGKKVSFILCGDFNSEPCSPVHSYIKNSISDKTFQDHAIMENFDSTVFNHTLKMESACGAPLFTNYTDNYQGCLDYIYYEINRLEVDKTYPMASEDKLSAHVGIPSVSFPSDHIPLIVDFKWKY